jgi:hypothetical protein
MPSTPPPPPRVYIFIPKSPTQKGLMVKKSWKSERSKFSLLGTFKKFPPEISRAFLYDSDLTHRCLWRVYSVHENENSARRNVLQCLARWDKERTYHNDRAIERKYWVSSAFRRIVGAHIDWFGASCSIRVWFGYIVQLSPQCRWGTRCFTWPWWLLPAFAAST